MDNLNYNVIISIQSKGTIGLDNDILCPVFKILSTKTITISLVESFSVLQNLDFIIKVEQL